MSIARTMQAELEHEAKTTRRFLERLPADSLAWKPHEKSLTAGQLAMHIAQVPRQVTSMGVQDDCPPPDSAGGFAQPQSVDEVLEELDASVRDAAAALGALDDAAMAGTWRLVVGDREIIAMPRIAFFRNILLNHWYHHRGQFGVYLRLLGASVPAAYGPSGDEMPPEFDAMAEAMASAS